MPRLQSLRNTGCQRSYRTLYGEELRAYVADVAMEEVMNTGNKMIEVLRKDYRIR